MSEEHTRLIIATMIVAVFVVVIVVTLIGLVDVSNPTVAKLVGAVFGYITALLNPIIFRYFGTAN